MSETGKCPRCGSGATFGYGLAGGGMGSYQMCDDEAGEDCDWFVKEQDGCEACGLTHPGDCAPEPTP